MLRRHSSLLLCVPISTHVVSSGGTSSSTSMMTPGMVDVSPKSKTHREATAIGHIWFPPKVAKQMLSVGNDEHGSTSKNSYNNSPGILEFCTKKGPIFTTAVIAATQAAKQTSNLIPFCHPIPITKCKVEWDTLSMVTVKNLSRSYNVRDAKFHVPFHLIEPTSGLMDLLEVNPKFHAKVCHDFVTSQNNTCPRGSSCPFVHPDLSSSSTGTAASGSEKRDHYQQEWFPESGREVLDKINDVYFRTLNHHPQQQQQQRVNKRHPFHHQHQQQQNHIILDKDNKLPELINVQGCLVPTEELELNRCINRVIEDPTAATKWCKDGEKCRNIDSCGFAHRRTTKRNKKLDRSAFWPSPSFLQDCKVQTAEKYGLRVYAKVTVGCGEWHTGVEMEALTATSTALLTLYDMCKGIDGAVDGGMRLGRVQLVEKIGGKSGHWHAAGTTSTTGSTSSSGNNKKHDSSSSSINQVEHHQNDERDSTDEDGF